MNELLTTIEIETNSSPQYAIIWMHGLGADGNDFVPIINELALPEGFAVRFIFPHAPERPVTINNGYVMKAWYDISHADIGTNHDEVGIRESQCAIDALIQQQITLGISSEKIFLAGFSQGGAMALHTGLRQQNKLAGILALSCYLPLSDALTEEAHAANANIPIFMAHGIHDAVIPQSSAISSREQLLAQHYQVEWHEYEMAHSVCQEEIADISGWLQRMIKLQG